MKELLLDCENEHAIYSSLSSILNISEKNINSVIAEYNIEEDQDILEYDLNELILSHFESKFKIKTDYAGSFFFHFTRVMPNTTFEEGLLNYSQMIPKISSLIQMFAGISEFEINNSKIIDCLHFFKKSANESLTGPYGFLIKDDYFFHPDNYPKYLEMPELIEDITKCRFSSISAELMIKYKELAKPCIIKFKTLKNDKALLGSALFFLYCLFHGIQPLDNRDCNYNYDGNGISIKREDIVKVLFDPVKPKDYLFY